MKFLPTLAMAVLLPAAALLSATAIRADTAADRFAAKRSFSTDIWVQWLPVTDMVNSPDFLDVYPDYPRTVPLGIFARLHRQGFDTIRIAADPSPLLALAGTPREAGLLTNLRQRVTEAQSAGFKVILDMHAYPHAGETGDIDAILATPAKFQDYLTMIGKVGARIADLDPNLTAFELMNEPTQDCDQIYSDPAASNWPQQLKRLHDAARATAPKLPLVLSGACWGGSKGLSVLDPAAIGDNNVIWSFHTYDPCSFSHQGASWTNSPLMFIKGLPYPAATLTDSKAIQIVKDALARAKAASGPVADATTRADLSQIVTDYRNTPATDAISAAIAEATTWADTNGIPRRRLFLGEFGALWFDDQGVQADPDSHARFLSAKRRAAEAAHVGWSVWSFSGSFGITGANMRLYPLVCTALGLTKC